MPHWPFLKCNGFFMQIHVILQRHPFLSPSSSNSKDVVVFQPPFILKSNFYENFCNFWGWIHSVLYLYRWHLDRYKCVGRRDDVFSSQVGSGAILSLLQTGGDGCDCWRQTSSYISEGTVFYFYSETARDLDWNIKIQKILIH